MNKSTYEKPQLLTFKDLSTVTALSVSLIPE